jgi:hypothetical protein
MNSSETPKRKRNTIRNNIKHNYISYNGHKLKVIRLNTRDFLYRANKEKFIKFNPEASIALPNHLAIEEYNKKKNGTNIDIKYFTLNKNELKAYTKYGMPYIKKWKPIDEIRLIDILHLPTRTALEKIIGSESLSISFPVEKNKVLRISEEDTKNHDDKVLQAICKLGLDGYYMKRLTNNTGNYIFHSEVGLCRQAFKKLRIDTIEKIIEPPRGPNKTRKNIETPTIQFNKKQNISRQLSFGNINTNNNTNNSNNINIPKTTRTIQRMLQFN